MKGRYKLSWLCEALMVSRSGYYDWIRRREVPGKRAAQNAVLRARIEQEFTRSRQTYGSHRIVRALGGGVSRNRVARIMREQHLRARQRSKYRVRTTDSGHGDPIALNRLPGIKIVKPDQVWATDATGILTGQGWLYVVALIDLFTRRIVGWSMSENLDANMACTALRMALEGRRPAAGLVVHSDRGTQFASLQYRTLLRERQCVASMSPRAMRTTTPISSRSGAASNTSWSTTASLPHGCRPAPLCSIILNRFTIAEGSTRASAMSARQCSKPNYNK
jgi:Transposase and inactivated derivatives